MLDSYPVQRVKAGFNDYQDKLARMKNEQMINMHEQNKQLNGIGGLEEITPNTSQEDAKKIMNARQHLENMASIPDSVGNTMSSVAKLPATAAEAILGSRAIGDTVSVIPEAINNGKVIMPQMGENAAQAYARVKKLLEK